ncbi:hypothetical protein AAFF_G00048400 [Aldrovandia affinis]|uniref:Uncharacterized protein n=1 Tax=Aldrovandia affinis TaxID=143900 RepID=A0AAD7WEP7_9TELE|nr:hypothetical protein AAFF_G00048400 [Aldrovandia affinis]
MNFERIRGRQGLSELTLITLNVYKHSTQATCTAHLQWAFVETENSWPSSLRFNSSTLVRVSRCSGSANQDHWTALKSALKSGDFNHTGEQQNCLAHNKLIYPERLPATQRQAPVPGFAALAQG